MKRSLAWRLVLVLMAALAVLLGLGGWYALELHRRQLYSLLEQSAIDTGETILSSTYSSMLKNDRDHLAQIVADIGRRSNVLALRLVDARGEVRFSKRPDEVGRVHDIRNAVCRGCHVGATVRAPEHFRDGLALYSLPTGEGALGLAIPILNSPECSSSGCHVHPRDQKVLGVLDIELSTAELEAGMREAGRQMTIFSIAAVLGISGVAGLLTWRVALRPLRALLDGIRRLGRGELSHRLPTEHPAEIGELAVSFNEMSRRLEKAQRELEAWNETLEARIREKTAELERTRDQMVFTEKMASLGKLAAIMAHEINNPLAGVLVYARLLRRRLAGLAGEAGREEAAQRLRQFDEKLMLIETETARCGDIVRNLLLFSRKSESAREPADPGVIIDRAIRLIRHQAELAQVVIEYSAEPGLPEITCNPAEIEQAVLALLINAIEAMPDGGRLEIAARRPAPGELEIVISDTGPGIPAELHSRVFEPFFSTKSAGKGTGLGLAVVYGIIQGHGGAVSLDAATGGGATFRIRLPAGPGRAGPPETGEALMTSTAGGGPSRGPGPASREPP